MEKGINIQGWLEPSPAKDGQHWPLRPPQVWGHQGSAPCPQPQGLQGRGQDQPSQEHQDHAAGENSDSLNLTSTC